MNTDSLWQTKLHARLHDPAEKALILMRDPAGHEGGTSKELHRVLFPQGLPSDVRKAVKRADWWASAADRAAFPKHDEDGRYPQWQQVEFHKKAVMIHPLTGQQTDLDALSHAIPLEQIKAVAQAHFKTYLDAGDLKKTALAFWRFGPEIEAPEIKSLWGLLPADTRVPDHTIWDHLDLVSAFAACFIDDRDGGPALLAVSLGPVQDFIAAARTTSDLWAGSHLLSRIAWEAMRVICDELGPEAILFPRLRGIPQVDVWLRDNCGLKTDWFKNCDWVRHKTDANPLFGAALPNRFTALVPAGRARPIAEKITATVRNWVLQQGEAAFRLLLQEAGIADDPALPAYAQLKQQLAGFPEVHWATVPWSLVDCAADNPDRVAASTPTLAAAMRPYFADASTAPGYLESAAWKLLQKDIKLEDGWFYQPNPGALYPALHELLERVLSATKSNRPFSQIKQQGWRCSLTGESEWLTTDREQLGVPPGSRKDTLWTIVAGNKRKRAWVKKGEHLGALSTLKRLWPTLFVRELKDILDQNITRFVVSTHTMAIATSLGQWLEKGEAIPPPLIGTLKEYERVALPRKLALSVQKHQHSNYEYLACIPAWLDSARDDDDENALTQAQHSIEKLLGTKPETYYALIQMDGDRMGAWLSAGELSPDVPSTLPHRKVFHPSIAQSLDNRFAGDQAFVAYADSPRGANPARHMAVSEALNNFALTLARDVVEEQHKGRVLYAGGDDVLAMTSVDDLLSTMQALRAAYSGNDGAGFKKQGNGFVLHKGKLLRLMGEKATASIGAVIAHHQAPLGAVLRELRVAEKRAKNEGGRDAFSITVIKRSGGALSLTNNWTRADGDSPMTCLRELSAALTNEEASRRAAFHVQRWTVDLPEPSQVGGEAGFRHMLKTLIAYQFDRQGLPQAQIHAQRLANMAPVENKKKAADFINNFLAVAEFLARETRA